MVVAESIVVNKNNQFKLHANLMDFYKIIIQLQQ